jgi:hypothetical protein
LGSTAPAIDPLVQPVTLQVGAFTATIPAGAFVNSAPGAWYFEGVIGGAGLQAVIQQNGTLRYTFYAAAWNATSLTGTANPVPITLTIGADTGTTSVTARIVNGLVVAH